MSTYEQMEFPFMDETPIQSISMEDILHAMPVSIDMRSFRNKEGQLIHSIYGEAHFDGDLFQWYDDSSEKEYRPIDFIENFFRRLL